MGSAPAYSGAPGAAPVHAPGLDLLRAVAVVWVMLFHSFVVGGLGPGFEWLSRYGWMGVDIFFVLSGYLIGQSVLQPLQQGRSLSLKAFYRRRAWRIVPAFAVVLAVYATFPALREAPGLQPWWQFATFTVNLLIDYGQNQAFSHAWSLCVEEHFYLVFPLLVLALKPKATLTRVLAFGLLLVALGVLLRGHTWLVQTRLDPPRPWFIEDIYYPTWARLDGLLAGVLLASLRVFRPQVWTRWQRHANAVLLAGLLAFALALWLFSQRTGLLANTLGWPVLSWSLALLVFAGAGRSSLIGRWPLLGARALAAASYSLYLSHKLVFHAVQTWVEPQWPTLSQAPLLRFATYVAATLTVGAALHHAVERPGLAWRDRRAAGMLGHQPLPASARPQARG
jgi:peptidoglycan/LPS O-acetylase OafA/YrhL